MPDGQEVSTPSQKEVSPTNTENRVLVLGSRVSGALELGTSFEEYLQQKGVTQPNVEVQRDAGYIEKYVLGRETVEEGRANPNLPKGVILLPEMRQYGQSGMGMTLRTYEEGVSRFVEELCEKYKVPLVEIKEDGSPEQIVEGIKGLLEKPREEK